MKIFLIGMPGSGKSTVGKQLAAKLNLPFVDLDEEIEKREGKLIKDIFVHKGEDYFRQVESNVLKDTAGIGHDMVVATGGGAPCFHDGIDIINASGISIFLDVSIDELVSRVQNQEERPLLLSSSKDELIEKLANTRNKRLSYYQQAKITVYSSTMDAVCRSMKI